MKKHDKIQKNNQKIIPDLLQINSVHNNNNNNNNEVIIQKNIIQKCF